VLLPTGLLLWFMSDSAGRQATAARQTTVDAYRTQLRLLRSRADDQWHVSVGRLTFDRTGAAASAAASQFADLVLAEQLDGAIVFDAEGHVIFPQLYTPVRWTVGDRRLLGLQRLDSGHPTFPARAAALAEQLNDYTVAMSSGQRLFLMGELSRLTTTAVAMPTQAALRLSTSVVERGIGLPSAGGLRQTTVPDVWAQASADRRVVGLYRTAHIQRLLDGVLAPAMSSSVRFVAYPPDHLGDNEAIAAGPSFPGWQLSFALLDDGIDASASPRFLTSLWAGFAVTSVVALAGIVAGQALRRQLRLARLRTDLTAAVSHELRAPLASAQVLIDGLLGDEQLDPVKTREYLELIAGEQARLSRVIENFLRFARMDGGRGRFDLVPTDPATVVASSVDAIRDRVPAASLRVEMAEDLPRVMADANALGTALVNLLDNALKFTPAQKDILVRVYADGGDVVFSVRDNGPGIPASERRRIFRRFYRIDQRLARETSGVGLGLSIVDLVVRAHKGSIDVSGEVGAGSTFAIRLPGLQGVSS
jgi:signal transduction histidine kinase